jgi:nicotinamide phosphoribosyltransferase
LIQGDGVNELAIQGILGRMLVEGWSADNIAFGMGGGLLQQVDRDTQRFAMKASAVEIGGVWLPIAKDPITDSGKKSKAGRVTLYQDRAGKFSTGVEDWEKSALTEVFRDGKLINEYTFDEVRTNSRK